MSTKWEDPDEARYRRKAPVNGYILFTVWLLVIVVLVLTTGCTLRTSESIPLPTSPSLDMELCHQVNIDETSALIPNDWDEWCVGFMGMAKADIEQSAVEHADACEGFWAASDEDILAAFMTESSRDRSIGAIDYMWTVC